jgi:hypothetical protein
MGEPVNSVHRLSGSLNSVHRMQTCQAVNLSAGVAPNPLGTMGRSAAIALTEKILMVSPSFLPQG